MLTIEWLKMLILFSIFSWIYTINRAEARDLQKSSETVTVQKEYNLKAVAPTIGHFENDGNLSVISDMKAQ